MDQFENELFIEIEAIDREDKFTDEELKAQCKSILSKLEIADEDLVKTGYFAD